MNSSVRFENEPGNAIALLEQFGKTAADRVLRFKGHQAMLSVNEPKLRLENFARSVFREPLAACHRGATPRVILTYREDES
jgi:hypothetical protein